MSDTQVLESPKTADTDTGPEVFHYVRRTRSPRVPSWARWSQALCGEVFPVTKTPKPGSPVCPACKEIYESLRG